MTKQHRQMFKFSDGRLWYRGPDDNALWFYRRPEEAANLIISFRRTANDPKWKCFAPMFLEYIRQIQEALGEYWAAQETENEDEELRWMTETAG